MHVQKKEKKLESHQSLFAALGGHFLFYLSAKTLQDRHMSKVTFLLAMKERERVNEGGGDGERRDRHPESQTTTEHENNGGSIPFPPRQNVCAASLI